MSARDLRGQGVRVVHRKPWRWAAHGRHLRLFVPTIMEQVAYPRVMTSRVQAVRPYPCCPGR